MAGLPLPLGGIPNNGGSQGSFQSNATNVALLRFIQGSPDFASTDVCLDKQPFVVAAPAVAYAAVSGGLVAAAGGVPHTVSVYPTLGGSAGAECGTAPAPFGATQPIAVTTVSPGVGANAVRETIVLGGTKASGTLGLYVFGEPSFAIIPIGFSAISHNAAAAFSVGKPSGVGFGLCVTTATPCAPPVALAGAQGVAAAKPSTVSAPVINGTVTSGINAIPAGFYDGNGATTGVPVPITSVASPAAIPFQPYVVEFYAIDAPAGGLNALVLLEQTLGFGI